MVKNIVSIKNNLFQRTKNFLKQVEKKIEAKPLRFFFIFLICLLALILLSNFLTKPKKKEDQVKKEARKVEFYNIGSAPRVEVQATVEKSGVITISALTAGVIQKVNVQEGAKVGRGSRLLWISSGYNGGAISSYQRELAARQYNFTKDTYGLQKDSIAKQRDVAFKTESNAYELREITRKSIDETKSLVSLNEEILKSLDSSLKTLEDTNVSGANDAAINSTKQIKAQVLAGLSQTRSALRASEYQVNADMPPAKLSELQKDLTLKALELQEKSLDLSLEVSRIQLRIAEIGESLNYPSAPIAGTVERVFVRAGQLINPGMPLVTISGTSSSLTAKAFIPAAYAKSMSRTEPSILKNGAKSVELIPYFISQEAVEGSLHLAAYKIPEDFSEGLSDKNIITVSLPIGSADTVAAVPFIPIDSVYQAADRAYVFVADGGVSKSKEIKTGQVFGSSVEVVSGLGKEDKVILDRTVVEGERVQ